VRRIFSPLCCMYKIIGADGREYGPISADQVRQFISENRVNASTMVLAVGATEWKPLGSFPEFSLMFAAAPMSSASPYASSSQRTHPLAIAALVLAIISITFGWCCCFLGLPLTAVALIFSIISLTEINKHPDRYTGKGL